MFTFPIFSLNVVIVGGNTVCLWGVWSDEKGKGNTTGKNFRTRSHMQKL